MRHQRPARRKTQRRKGLSLLEVVVAIAILALSMVAISQLVGMGTRSAAFARDTTRAQILCQNKMVELASLTQIPVNQSNVGLEEDSNFTFSITQQPIGTTGLVSVTVTVMQKRANAKLAATYSLSRWLVNREAEVFQPALTDDDLGSSANSGFGATP